MQLFRSNLRHDRDARREFEPKLEVSGRSWRSVRVAAETCPVLKPGLRGAGVCLNKLFWGSGNLEGHDTIKRL